MRNIILFFVFSVTEFIFSMAGYGQNYNYYPLKEFNGDTVAFYNRNFSSCMRYDGKNFDAFFEDFEEDIPIRTAIFFLAGGGDAIGYIFFFTETKEQVENQLKKRGRYYGIATNIRGLLLKDIDPDSFHHIKSWGFGKFIDMTDEIRQVMKNKKVDGIWYDFLSWEFYQKHKDEKAKD